MGSESSRSVAAAQPRSDPPVEAPAGEPVPAPRPYRGWMLRRRANTSVPLLAFLRRVAMMLIIAALVIRWSDAAETTFFYWPTREAFVDPPGVENVTFETSDDLTLHGWFLPAEGAEPGEARPAVLHVHGNAGNVAWHLEYTEFLRRGGFHVLLFDYRRFGRSDRQGRLKRAQVRRDADAALDYLLSRPDVDPQRVGIYGYSLGGVYGLDLAARRPEVRAVISLAAFSEWAEVASDHAPDFLARLLIRPGADAVRSVERLGERPLLLVHGTRDVIVPVRHVRAIEAAAVAAGVPTESHVIEGADHLSVFHDDPGLEDRMIAFFQENLLGTVEVGGGVGAAEAGGAGRSR